MTHEDNAPEPLPDTRHHCPRTLALLCPEQPGRVHFEAGTASGSGLILDISSDGAFVYRPSRTLRAGARLDLVFVQARTLRCIRASGEVVRAGASGFAVRFLTLTRELERLSLGAAA